MRVALRGILDGSGPPGDPNGVFRVIALTTLLAAPTTAAQTRPTSDDVSVLSGRTVGNGEVVLAAGLGWPGFWAEVLLAPSSQFNLSIRAGFHYGSPLLGLETGVGGELSFPMRLLLYGEDNIDLAAYLRPFGIVGEGVLVGQEGTFANDIGWAVGTDAGLKVGFHVSDAVTLGTGTLVRFAYVDTPDASDGNGIVLGVAILASVEANMSRATTLFLELQGGYGFAADRLFNNHAMLVVSFGLAYRL